jgi:hypothetical protein
MVWLTIFWCFCLLFNSCNPLGYGLIDEEETATEVGTVGYLYVVISFRNIFVLTVLSRIKLTDHWYFRTTLKELLEQSVRVWACFAQSITSLQTFCYFITARRCHIFSCLHNAVLHTDI